MSGATDFEVFPAGTLKRLGNAGEILTHAAELLEQEAEALRQAHTVDGRWEDGEECDAAAHAEYDDWLCTARQLRSLAAGVQRD